MHRLWSAHPPPDDSAYLRYAAAPFPTSSSPSNAQKACGAIHSVTQSPCDWSDSYGQQTIPAAVPDNPPTIRYIWQDYLPTHLWQYLSSAYRQTQKTKKPPPATSRSKHTPLSVSGSHRKYSKATLYTFLSSYRQKYYLFFILLSLRIHHLHTNNR